MARNPVYPIHILYDPRVIGEEALFRNFLAFTSQLAEMPEINQSVRINLLCVGGSLDEPYGAEEFQLRVKRDDSMHLDLNAAFQQVLTDYSVLDQSFIGIGNPEVLLLVGTQTGRDWTERWQNLGMYRALIISYWFSCQPLGEYERYDVERLLRRISPPDPESNAPHHKIVESLPAEQSSALEDIFSKLRDRLAGRVKRGRTVFSV
jgi:hypothetical protein